MACRRSITPFLFSLTVLAFACSTASINVRSVRIEMSWVKKSIQNKRENMLKLKDWKISDKGFFYVIDQSGRVVYHPQELLIGRNFIDYWFIKVILSDRNGCIKYNVGNTEHYIFFESLNTGEILCYSIASREMDAPVSRCKSVSSEEVEAVPSE